MSTTDAPITIPADLLPADGRFGSGPSKVRAEQFAELVERGPALLGTSHRQAPVKNLVASVQEGIAALYNLPEGYQVVLGNGGATAFWDIAAFGLVDRRAHHLVCGEFSKKFAKATTAAPFLETSTVQDVTPGQGALPVAEPGADVVAWPHNETSTGVMIPVVRPDSLDDDALVVVDGTSAAAGIAADLSQCDVYYFSLQKGFASEGGIWFAIMSPAALDRARRIASSGRWIPDFLSLTTAIDNSAKHQTYNTPAVAPLILADAQVRWLNESGGLAWADARTRESSSRLYRWADERDWASPFVADPAFRSQVVVTVDLADEVPADKVLEVLRAHGVVDAFAYRALKRNQLRVACFPAVEPDDVTLFTRCVDFVVDHL